MGRVKITAGYGSRGSYGEATVVEIAESGHVMWQGEQIGIVAKGYRTYSPPMHKGSRIVRYHKQVAEWHAWGAGLPTHGRPTYRGDSRMAVVRELVAAALNTDKEQHV